jgi:multidrug efflux pump subunit AcrA (membrane-fusion protein)
VGDPSAEATEKALLAKLAAQQGRLENAKTLADQAVKEAERAAKQIEKITDPEEKARATERIAEAKATADEARSKIKQNESQQLEERAKGQADTLKEIEQQITDLQNKAANLKLSVEISEATAAIQQIQSELAAIQDKTVTVTVNQVQAGGSPDAPVDLTQFWSGGFTGHGGKFDPAGIVHRGEFVARAEVVRQAGALEFLRRFNELGMRALPGFASGGLVSRIPLGSLPSHAPQRQTAVFNFPDIGRYPVSMAQDDLARLQSQFGRAALQSGGRK